MFDLAHSTTAEKMCHRCPVTRECSLAAETVRPVAGRWAGKVYEAAPSGLGIRGRVQWRVYDAVAAHGPIIDPDGGAMLGLAKLCHSSLNSTNKACQRLRSLGLIEYDAVSAQGTYRIALAVDAEGAA